MYVFFKKRFDNIGKSVVKKSSWKSEEAMVKTPKFCFVLSFRGKEGDLRLHMKSMLSCSS